LQHHSAGDGFEDRMQIRCRSRFQVLELVSEYCVDSYLVREVLSSPRYRYFARALVRVRSPLAAPLSGRWIRRQNADSLSKSLPSPGASAGVSC
jgi:hypothetical protein